MRPHLYFICPTDHLEVVIDNTFKQENYYYTSLGNSMVFDGEIMGEINALIETKGIREITFILSDNNQMVMDALKSKDFAYVRGLNSFYYEIGRQKKRSEVLWKTCDLKMSVLSHHLNMKINELQPRLSNWYVGQVKIDAKIYNRQRNVFSKVHSDLLWKQHLSLN